MDILSTRTISWESTKTMLVTAERKYLRNWILYVWFTVQRHDKNRQNMTFSHDYSVVVLYGSNMCQKSAVGGDLFSVSFCQIKNVALLRRLNMMTTIDPIPSNPSKGIENIFISHWIILAWRINRCYKYMKTNILLALAMQFIDVVCWACRMSYKSRCSEFSEFFHQLTIDIRIRQKFT